MLLGGIVELLQNRVVLVFLGLELLGSFPRVLFECAVLRIHLRSLFLIKNSKPYSSLNPRA